MPPRVLAALPSPSYDQWTVHDLMIAHNVARAVHRALGPREHRGRAAARIYSTMPLDVKFEMLDLDGDFTQMFHMLDHSVAQRDFLLNYIKFSRGFVGRWAIEERPLFAPYLQALELTVQELQ